MELRIAYGGPRGSGKTANLYYLQSAISGGDLAAYVTTSISSVGKAPIDFLYFDIERKDGDRLHFRITALPQMEDYLHLWKMILRDCHGIVIVIDSQMERMEENQSCLRKITDILSSWKIAPEEFPILLQYNKCDLPYALSGEELAKRLNLFGRSGVEASAARGTGVLNTFMKISKLVLMKKQMEKNSHGKLEGGLV
ncbi:MAG: ADP-ribosylation factor-like protein [Candidatus Glassbacteria bacterium]